VALGCNFDVGELRDAIDGEEHVHLDHFGDAARHLDQAKPDRIELRAAPERCAGRHGA
jgi:hypothetical protein